ncbi:protein of unknown function (DUF3328) domain containing protein [Rhypophila decipiens]
MMNSPQYHDLRKDLETNDVRHSRDGSSLTEYDDEDKAHQHWQGSASGSSASTKTKCARFWETFKSFRSILDTVLLVVILVLLIERTGRQPAKPAEFEFAGDLTGFAPRFSQQIKTFVPDLGFIPENVSEFFSQQVQNKWLGLVPRGLGYVLIDDTSAYNNLPTKLETYPDSTFTTSVTHQLHCLHAIIGTVAALTSNQPEKGPDEGAWHLAHCFEYLRQTIMCCGDVALEGQATTFPDGMTGSDGWDATHVCKDYNAILEYLEDNRVDDERWI